MSENKYGPNTAKVEAFLALLPKMTDEQREAAREAAWDASWTVAWNAATAAARATVRYAARTSAWDAAASAAETAAWAATWAAVALVMRDIITPDQFDTLTAPMRAAEIDFDALTTTTNGSGPNTADWRDDPANAWCKVCDRGLEGCTHDRTGEELMREMSQAALVALSEWIDAGNAHRDPEAVTWGRLAKVAEEGGEVVSAYIGATGQNPRKGQTHAIHDVVDELMDVAITALGAVEHLTGHEGTALAILDAKIVAVASRAGLVARNEQEKN